MEKIRALEFVEKMARQRFGILFNVISRNNYSDARNYTQKIDKKMCATVIITRLLDRKFASYESSRTLIPAIRDKLTSCRQRIYEVNRHHQRLGKTSV